jgi:hypothetical protein
MPFADGTLRTELLNILDFIFCKNLAWAYNRRFTVLTETCQMSSQGEMKSHKPEIEKGKII